MTSSPCLPRDLPGPLGGHAQPLPNSCPRVKLTVELQCDPGSLALDDVLDPLLQLGDSTPSIKGLTVGEGACDRGVYLVDWLTHKERVWRDSTSFKRPLDGVQGVWFSLIKQALHGAAHSYQAMPDEPIRGCSKNQNRADRCDSYITDGRPSPPGSLKGTLMATADSIGAINRAVNPLSDADSASLSPATARLRATTTVAEAEADARGPIVAPFSSQTRVAIIGEFRAARDRRDVQAARLIYRTAADHDATYPEEPSLVDELIGLHVAAMGLIA